MVVVVLRGVCMCVGVGVGADGCAVTTEHVSDSRHLGDVPEFTVPLVVLDLHGCCLADSSIERCAAGASVVACTYTLQPV